MQATNKDKNENKEDDRYVTKKKIRRWFWSNGGPTLITGACLVLIMWPEGAVWRIISLATVPVLLILSYVFHAALEKAEII